MSHFTFLMVNRLCLVHVPAFPTCTAFPRLSFVVCVFFPVVVFLFLKFQVLWLKCLSFAFILDMERQDVLPPCYVWLPWSLEFLFFSFVLTPIIHLCLICCSFPLASAPPFLPTIGLNRSGSQSATPVGGKIKTLLFKQCSFYLFYHPASSALNSSSSNIHSPSGSGMLGCVVSGC